MPSPRSRLASSFALGFVPLLLGLGGGSQVDAVPPAVARESGANAREFGVDLHSAYELEGERYDSYAAFVAAQRARAAKRLEERGEVWFGGGWVPWNDVPYLRLGWRRGDDGRLAPPQVAVPLPGPGWSRRRSGAFELLSPLSDDEAARALAAVQRVGPDLRRVLGLEPALPVVFAALPSLRDYNAFAGGAPARGVAPTENTGLSGCHYAYFADAWFAPTRPLRTFVGTGVAAFESEGGELAAFAEFAARHAAALAWLEAVDPSPGAVADATLTGAPNVVWPAYWEEKRLPRWFFLGAAVYAERLFVDRTPDVEDPLWARRWALDNCAQRLRGAPPDLARALACELDGLDPQGTFHTLELAGVLVAFVVDGGAPAVRAAHVEVVAALRAAADSPDPATRRRRDGDVRRACRDLERILRTEEEGWRAFVEGPSPTASGDDRPPR